MSCNEQAWKEIGRTVPGHKCQLYREVRTSARRLTSQMVSEWGFHSTGRSSCGEMSHFNSTNIFKSYWQHRYLIPLLLIKIKNCSAFFFKYHSLHSKTELVLQARKCVIAVFNMRYVNEALRVGQKLLSRQVIAILLVTLKWIVQEFWCINAGSSKEICSKRRFWIVKVKLLSYSHLYRILRKNLESADGQTLDSFMAWNLDPGGDFLSQNFNFNLLRSTSR